MLVLPERYETSSYNGIRKRHKIRVPRQNLVFYIKTPSLINTPLLDSEGDPVFDGFDNPVYDTAWASRDYINGEYLYVVSGTGPEDWIVKLPESAQLINILGLGSDFYTVGGDAIEIAWLDLLEYEGPVVYGSEERGELAIYNPAVEGDWPTRHDRYFNTHEIPSYNKLVFLSEDGLTDTIGLSVSELYPLLDSAVQAIVSADEGVTKRSDAEICALAWESQHFNEGTMVGDYGNSLAIYASGTDQSVLNRALIFFRQFLYLQYTDTINYTDLENYK